MIVHRPVLTSGCGRNSRTPLTATGATIGSGSAQESVTACSTTGPRGLRLPASTPLFRVPSGLARILDRDLAVAGIPKRDERNRVVDVHALRVTFGTHLCAAGVPLRTAQAAMRHSKPELTANVYTDPKLLDVAGALDALPALTLPTDGAATETAGDPVERQILRRATS